MENDFQIKYLQLTDNTLNPPHTTHMNLSASPQCTGERAIKCKTATVCGVRVSSKTERFLIRCLSHLVYEHLEADMRALFLGDGHLHLLAFVVVLCSGAQHKTVKVKNDFLFFLVDQLVLTQSRLTFRWCPRVGKKLGT